LMRHHNGEDNLIQNRNYSTQLNPTKSSTTTPATIATCTC
jgi:hypothetical protein